MNQEMQIWQPKDLIAVLNQTLEYAYPEIEVEGEVAGFKINQNKFVFFEIKDEQASINCFMMLFSLRQPIEDGMRVRIKAQPKITAWGKFSLTVNSIRLVGEGSIAKAFQILQSRLTSEGLFEAARKRAMPIMPERIAVISSEQAAGYADFMHILANRWAGLEILVKQVSVQGENAADQMILAIEQINQLPNLPELIAIIRGGGSKDDLACFNDEKLVRAIASSRIPIITGIGHEVDTSLADLAADFMAVTPTHAAQTIVPDKQAVIESVNGRLVGLIPLLNQQLNSLIETSNQKIYSVKELINQRWQTLSESLSSYKILLESYNPERILERGYALVRGQISVGSTIEIETNHMLINAEVKDVKVK